MKVSVYLSRRRQLAVGLVGLVAFIVNAAISLSVRRPEPAFHDEFSYLLAADTFASGRLTNPTHPMWPHFESFHILHRPTYQSKYPPAQGLFLAAGQVVGGHPMVGLWLMMGLACAALTWMLQGWMPARWAFLGGLIVSFHPFVVSWWGQTYWGGAVAMLGGALVYGALPRLRRKVRVRHGLLMGLGLALLANSRPFEGFIASLPALVLLFVVLLDRRKRLGGSIRNLWFPLVAVGLAAAAWMGYYNYRVTGDPLVSPYRVWLDTYQSPDTVHQHQELAEYQGSPDITVTQKLRRIRAFYLPVPLLVPLVMLPWMLRDPRIRFALLVSTVVIAVVVAGSRGWPHYTAPVACLIFMVVARGLGYVYACRRRSGPYRWLLIGAVAAVVLANAFSLVSHYVRQEPAIWFQSWSLARARMLDVLVSDDRPHLVVVRYARTHDVHREWIYNRADINGAKVVWAREMQPEENRKLFDYFQYRRRWLLEADANPPRLTPYPSMP